MTVDREMTALRGHGSEEGSVVLRLPRFWSVHPVQRSTPGSFRRERNGDICWYQRRFVIPVRRVGSFSKKRHAIRLLFAFRRFFNFQLTRLFLFIDSGQLIDS